jgi:hypothetical protein
MKRMGGLTLIMRIAGMGLNEENGMSDVDDEDCLDELI